MEIIAKTNYIRVSPLKLSLIARPMINLKPDQALVILKSLPQKSANLLIKVIKQAIGNAVTNYKLDKESLIIKKIIVNKGPMMKRGQPVSRGQYHRILKPTSHLTLILDGESKKEVKSGQQSQSA